MSLDHGVLSLLIPSSTIKKASVAGSAINISRHIRKTGFTHSPSMTGSWQLPSSAED
jgi:hypothetical protein